MRYRTLTGAVLSKWSGSATLAAGLVCGMMAMPPLLVGQSKPAATPVAAKYTGCVRRLETDKDTLVLDAPSVCAKLTGKFAAEDIAGHEVELTGVLTDAGHGVPAAIDVSSVGSVGKSCSSKCSLWPPKTRGLGKGGELPGKEGGTPGVAPTQPQ